MDIVLIINIITFLNLTILGTILLLKRPRVLHNQVLSFLVYTPAVAVLFNTLLYYDSVDKFPLSLFLTFNMNMLWSPMFLFYVLLLTGFTLKFRMSYLLHFVPFILGLSIITPIMFLPKAEFQAFMDSAKMILPWQFNLLNNILAVQCITYVVVAAIVLLKYNKAIKNLFSDIHRISVFWLQEMIVIGFVLFISIIPPIVYFQKLDSFLYFLPIGLNFFYLFTVYKAISSPVLLTPQVRAVLSLKTEVSHQLKITKSTGVEKGDREDLTKEAQCLKEFFQENRPYLNPELNIKLLSEQSGVSVPNLSATINQCFGQNFYDFVNQYRVKYAEQLLSSEEFDNYKIDVLASECGFRTRSVFYTAFKKVTGYTPSEYKKMLKTV